MHLFTAATTIGIHGILKGQLTPVARLSRNMQRMQYTDDEVMLMSKALFSSATKQDAREAWHVLDRRRTGTIPAGELLATLVDMLGKQSRTPLQRMIARLPSKSTSIVHGVEQLVSQSEFTTLCADVVADAEAVVPMKLGGFLAEEANEWASERMRDAANVGKAWQALELVTLARVPPPLLPRAGAVVDRMLKAEFTPHDISTAVAALYGRRDARAMARLWGLFDLRRQGSIPVGDFDAAMLLLTEAVTAADLPAVSRVGFERCRPCRPAAAAIALQGSCSQAVLLCCDVADARAAGIHRPRHGDHARVRGGAAAAGARRRGQAKADRRR